MFSAHDLVAKLPPRNRLNADNQDRCILRLSLRQCLMGLLGTDFESSVWYDHLHRSASNLPTTMVRLPPPSHRTRGEPMYIKSMHNSCVSTFPPPRILSIIPSRRWAP
ncbi:hypothetical protein K443DRAFT_270824 [Laccaria amethystina LaAM-08-1]|uniref:Uncharacterized protein n=1 Tax=Laccaria amethystina LaAM-08-1 TaxID=1095629 RepID=A0A0C9X6D0_9AGAR|nr:hypothetical protein K443DRAFT_270824 [Laccaria amethystina LaAM-08-1]